ncbi:hypothetical protein Snov_4367 [Ancylobacter novellus DSM 506]|uniref:Uncharacterized protein n=1 Tax=Ancylobacter novellus (strain ATCC 8093 / DSM 506 / JCM 20403 / CCM 1077 / IAM 12100 / NBRC 12443 / NCIMB 10456) TaxID=639283 RepID=D7A2U5_ANCN5|nr:hypothetical protein Snov_4367 [Ancylobacter novellus DSM 506]
MQFNIFLVFQRNLNEAKIWPMVWVAFVIFANLKKFNDISLELKSLIFAGPYWKKAQSKLVEFFKYFNYMTASYNT